MKKRSFRVVSPSLALAIAALLSACQSNENPLPKIAEESRGASDSQPRFEAFAADLPSSGFYDNAESTPVNQMIQGARSELDIAVYEMNDPDIIAAIRKALARSVRVRVIKEPSPVGEGCNVFAGARSDDKPACADQKKLRQEITQNGGSYVPFEKDQLCADSSHACYLHGKIIVADRKAALVSTGNFNSSNLCNLDRNPAKCNRDYSVVTRDGDVVKTLNTVFEKDLAGKRYDLARVLSSADDKLTVSPLSLRPLLDLISSARSTIRIQNQYLKEATINQALIDAAQRGVRVEVMVASVCSFGHPSASEANQVRKIFQPFDAAGIRTRMFPARLQVHGKPGYLHAKAIVVDDTRAWVGSVNGSAAAMSNNREFGLFFTDPSWISPLVRIMSSDQNSRDSESWQESLECAKDHGSSSASDGDDGAEELGAAATVNAAISATDQ